MREEPSLDSGKAVSATEIGRAAVNGATLYYETRGAGHPLTLLHMESLDCRMWDDQFAVFAHRYRVLRYDDRNHGQSARVAERYAPVRDLSALLQSLRIGKTSLLGVSQGAATAIDFALTYPETTAALVLAAPGLHGYLPPDFEQSLREKMAPILPVWEHAVQTGDPSGLIAAMMDDAASVPAHEHAAARRRLREILTENAHVFLSPPSLPLSLDPPASRRLGAIHAPTLILVGERDDPMSHDIADKLEGEIAGARKVVLPGAPRLMNMDRPGEFNRIVLDFLSDVARPE